jgi:AraC-like DNA-binding protein
MLTEHCGTATTGRRPMPQSQCTRSTPLCSMSEPLAPSASFRARTLLPGPMIVAELCDERRRYVGTGAKAAAVPTRDLIMARGPGCLNEAEDGIGSSTVTSRVRDIIRDSPTPAVSCAMVAQALFVSESHLRRLLAAEGNSFRRIRDEHRTGLALEALQSGRPLEVLSNELGFSDKRAFRRAFRRWTGDSPTSMRALMSNERCSQAKCAC